MRIDKYLWCVRVFKTRTEATEAVNGGRVTLNDNPTKASREVSVGDSITVRRGAVRLQLRVKGLPKSRLGAPLVAEYLEDLTPPEVLAARRAPRAGSVVIAWRKPGEGRPTKRDRRELDALQEQLEGGREDDED